MTRRILITGGAGFIGSHLADALVAGGHAVAILDNFRTGRRGYLPEVATLYEADITDPAAVRHAIQEFRPEVISHHAGQINVRESVASPLTDAAINILGSLMLLEACAGSTVEHLLFASTGGALYGDEVPRPTPETAPATPQSPYGIAKLTVEEYLRVLGPLQQLAVTVFRYANVYGPRQIVEGEAGVIAIFCERLRAGQVPTIYGDGEQTRDYIHVQDIVSANLAAIEERITGTFNLGTSVGTSLNQATALLLRAANSQVEVEYRGARAGEIRNSVLDATQASAALGWSAKIPLEAGLADTWSWFAERLER